MFTLIKNAHIYAPADTGCQDLLLAGRKIVHMAPSIGELPFDCTVIDVSGAKVTTGFIDQHIHITGGGGEGSFATRVPEIQLSQLTTAGTTTVIGLLGTDGVTRSMENLLAKARGLEEEGISTWIYSGAYPEIFKSAVSAETALCYLICYIRLFTKSIAVESDFCPTFTGISNCI